MDVVSDPTRMFKLENLRKYLAEGPRNSLDKRSNNCPRGATRVKSLERRAEGV